MLTRLDQDTPEYATTLRNLARRGDADLESVEPVVRDIIHQVRERGDQALSQFSLRFDGRVPESFVVHDWRERAKSAVSAATRSALQQAADRIRRYHEHQRDGGFRYREDGIELGQRVRPMRSVAVYAPGGKARYPSTVLMTAIPASVAGVPRIVLVTPKPEGAVLAAAELAGVTEVIDAGGAQAVAAVAYGTESIQRVDKIVGPGNLYVTCAKRLVFGIVDIDSIAGPSEILVVADEGANPRVVAADLLSQAEHDEAAYPLLITLSTQMADAVDREVERQLALLPRREIATASLRDHGYCFVVGELAEAARVADLIAAEHLSLQVREPDLLFTQIGTAGAVFLGDHTPEAAGDYAAGPSHVLPTGGAARFCSPLGVYDFVLRTSLIKYDREAILKQKPLLAELARMEGLEAHARASLVRE
jgi:histidinol dehydrogenase